MADWITNICSTKGKESVKSGFIANNQMAYFAQKIGINVLNWQNLSEMELSDEDANPWLESLLFPIKKGDTVFVQFPTWQKLQFEKIFFDILLKKNVRIVLMIWDVLSWLHDDSVRDYSKDYAFELMRKVDVLIVPNKKMGKRIINEGKVNTPQFEIGIWDFKIDNIIEKVKYLNRMYFVGTLDKTDFSTYKSKNTDLYLIGNEKSLTNEEKANSNLVFLGERPNSEVPELLEGGYGIVSYQQGRKNRFKGAEKYGEFNNPLKLSLYIARGIPVIVNSKMAHSDFIRKNNLGLILDDWNDIDLAVKYISEDDYYEMVRNVEIYSEKVRSGYFTQTVLKRVLNYLKEN